MYGVCKQLVSGNKGTINLEKVTSWLFSVENNSFSTRKYCCVSSAVRFLGAAVLFFVRGFVVQRFCLKLSDLVHVVSVSCHHHNIPSLVPPAAGAVGRLRSALERASRPRSLSPCHWQRQALHSQELLQLARSVQSDAFSSLVQITGTCYALSDNSASNCETRL